MKDDFEKQDRAEWKRLVGAAGCVADAADPTPGFTGKVMAAIAADRRRAAVARRRRRAGIAAGIAAALVAAAVCRVALRPVSAPAGSAAASEILTDVDRLVALQRADGRWQSGPSHAGYDPAMTALALLAVARHEPVRHAASVSRAAAALEALQQKDGSFGGDDSSLLYNAAFATYALLEVARADGSGITPAIDRAIAFAETLQNAEGYWVDPARTVWLLGVLSKAQELGWNDPHGALRRGLAWLRREAEGGILDYRVAIDHSQSPPSGGIVLTQLATESVTGALRRYGLSPALAGNLAASFGSAYGRRSTLPPQDGMEGTVAAAAHDAPGGVYATVISLLSSKARR